MEDTDEVKTDINNTVSSLIKETVEEAIYDAMHEVSSASSMDEVSSASSMDEVSSASSPITSPFAGVVKIYTTAMEYDYAMPWQMQTHIECTASGFVIEGRRILTNAHAVDHWRAVRVRKYGDPTKYSARVVAIGNDSDMAVLTVDDDMFWTDLPTLTFGDVPNMQDNVTVIGYPTGGDSLSITAGVVSRVEMHTYAQSNRMLMAVQIDAAINPGNSGGPAFHNDKVVGIAFQGIDDTDGIGYIIPTPVIRHFLEDVETRDTHRIGFGSLGCSFQMVENHHMAAALHIIPPLSGVRITTVSPVGSTASTLRRNDVLTHIDGCCIAHDGTVKWRGSERLPFAYILTRHHIGDDVSITFLRDGIENKAVIVLHDYSPVIPFSTFNKPPSFYMYGGMVFTVLTRPYIEMLTASGSISTSILSQLGRTDKLILDEQVVMMSMLLPHPTTIGYNPCEFVGRVISRVNGISVKNLAHVRSLIEGYTLPMMTVDLADTELQIVMDVESANKATEEIMAQHHMINAFSDDLSNVGSDIVLEVVGSGIVIQVAGSDILTEVADTDIVIEVACSDIMTEVADTDIVIEDEVAGSDIVLEDEVAGSDIVIEVAGSDIVIEVAGSDIVIET